MSPRVSSPQIGQWVDEKYCEIVPCKIREDNMLQMLLNLWLNPILVNYQMHSIPWLKAGPYDVLFQGVYGEFPDEMGVQSFIFRQVSKICR